MKFFFLTFLLLCAFFVSAPAQESTVAENKVVYVIGAVIKSSEIKLEKGMTLTQAIAKVGGLSKDNKGQIVRLYRRVLGSAQPEVIKISLKEIRKGKIEDLVLQPLDIIEAASRKRIKGGNIDYLGKSFFPTLYF